MDLTKAQLRAAAETTGQNSAKKKEGAAPRALVVVGRSIVTAKTLLARDEATGAVVTVRLTLRGVIAGHFATRQRIIAAQGAAGLEYDGNPTLSPSPRGQTLESGDTLQSKHKTPCKNR